jgi:chromate reductase, NAD(P)H dehydrogenase (quinone)
MNIEESKYVAAPDSDIAENQIDIMIVTGSLRKGSLTQKMAKVLSSLAPDAINPVLVNIGDLPIYNEDLETDHPPVEWVRFREEIRKAKGLLFVTPEYNRSVPAVLKNAIDVGSAPHDQNVFESKPAAIVSLSPGAMGAFGANHHLRQSLVFLNVPTMQQPEAYIGNSEQLFDEHDNLINEGTKAYLSKFMHAFVRWVKNHQ